MIRALARPSMVLAVVGLLVSLYLTIEHFTTSAILACPENSTVNCAKVTTSPYSAVFGFPVALLGLLYFVVMTLLMLPAAWRIPALVWVRLAGCVAGVVMVLYLVWAELFRINALCLWCTAVHVCTIALLGAVLWESMSRSPVSEPVR